MKLHKIVMKKDSTDVLFGTIVKNALIDGQKYEMTLYKEDPNEFFTRVDSVYNTKTKKHKILANPKNLPQFICQCGCDAFTLNYGFATCINCNKTQDIN